MPAIEPLDPANLLAFDPPLLRGAALGGRHVWGVGALLQAVGDALAGRFSACIVHGELSGFARAGSGHCYFNLKDADGAEGSLRCAMFRRAAGLVGFAPADGQLVELRGRLGVFAPRGELQLIVESMQRAGAGALLEQYLRLKARLEAEGLFDPARKRPPAAYPSCIGIVTSLDGAALHDVVSSLARRSPHVAVIVYPSPVQGVDAPQRLADALALAGRRREADTLVLCRGGGALEDLWAFNDERVVQAIAASPIPVISGVGHETDTTLADFAADLRAPTPTAAAELATPATADCLDRLATCAMRLQRRLRQTLDGHAQRLDAKALRLARPGERVHREIRRGEALARRLVAARVRAVDSCRRAIEAFDSRRLRSLERELDRRRQRLDASTSRLSGVDPHRILRRGYAWLADGQGRPVASVEAVATGDVLSAVLHDGRIEVRVASVLDARGTPVAR